MDTIVKALSAALGAGVGFGLSEAVLGDAPPAWFAASWVAGVTWLTATWWR